MQETDSIDINALLYRCQTVGMEAIVEIYELYRDEFLHYSKQFTPNRELTLNAYHDAVIIFYEKLINKKFQIEKSHPKTYLFAIARYKLFDALKKQSTIITLEDLELTEAVVSDFSESEPTENDRLLQKALQQLGKKCREILTLFYYHEYSPKAIMERMNYDNINVVYSHKSRCLKQLKQIFLDKKS